MPVRTLPFVNGEYYHVFNRGVAKIPIYYSPKDYNRFIESMVYYQLEGPKPRFSLFNSKNTILNPTNKIIDFISYCLMPNHFHFLVQQTKKGGVSEFVSKLTNSYTKYFNTKNRRLGHLFQGMFKAVHIETNEQLLHVSRYVHLNPVTNYVAKDLDSYPWSSFHEYTANSQINICSKSIILEQFKSRENYKSFILDQEDYAKKLEIIKHQLLDFED